MTEEKLYELGRKIGGSLLDKSLVRFCIEDALIVAINDKLITDEAGLMALLSDDCLHWIRKCFEAGIMDDWSYVMKTAIKEGLEEVEYDTTTD